MISTLISVNIKHKRPTLLVYANSATNTKTALLFDLLKHSRHRQYSWRNPENIETT